MPRHFYPGGVTRWSDRSEQAEFVVSALLLLVGLVALLTGHEGAASATWLVATGFGLVLSSIWLVRELRAHHLGVDVVAWLALAGTLFVDEPLAGAIITLMLTTGRLLEARAQERAKRDLTLLVERAPHNASRISEGQIESVPVAEVVAGDRLLVASGSIVPVDGRLMTSGTFDESSLTGEPGPVDRTVGEDIRSGVLNSAGAVEMLATTTAAESTYSQIVRLVEESQASSAPFVRTADRFAIVFVPLTIIVALASWGLTGDPVRAVAVLVVATPCPLLLAAPIAIMSGLSQAARSGAVVKGGAALEQLASGRVLLFDKTGTLTVGHPVLSDIVTDGRPVEEVLGLVASLDQVSSHVLAGAIVEHAGRTGAALAMPSEVNERHGYGIEGRVGERSVRIGRLDWVTGDHPPTWLRRAARRSSLEGCLSVFVSVDGVPAAALLFEDPLRPDAHRMLRSLRSAGFERVVLVTGDRADVAESVGRLVGVDAVRAETDPREKVAVVREEASRGPVVMVGDGINDAPALATASVGVALAARGRTASSEAADVVLTVERLDRLADVMAIARRSQGTARMSVVVGMGLAALAMAVAAAGYLAPAAGAITQELIDVLAIGVALTALRPPPRVIPRMTDENAELVRQHLTEHRSVAQTVERVRSVADALGDSNEELVGVQSLMAELEDDLLPHEQAEEAELLPLMSGAMGGPDALVGISRTHAEIEHQVLSLQKLVATFGPGPIDPDDVHDLRRRLYGLYGVLRLHNAQEEEELYSLVQV
jgi:heavy metal translocating P-type ATPase